MRVLNSKVDKDNKVWLEVELVRSTDVLLNQLYTPDDLEYAREEAVREFLNSLFLAWKR